jgi:uncharacterized protein (DUF302 family)
MRGLFGRHDMTDASVSVSRYAYGETIDRLTKAIADAGSTIFAKIDQSAAASVAGLHLRPTTLLIFGNPKGGTPLMDAFPLVALDLPLKCIVFEEQGAVNVAYVPVSVIAARYSVTGKEALVANLDQALAALVHVVA